jgi:hypothetical protein
LLELEHIWEPPHESAEHGAFARVIVFYHSWRRYFLCSPCSPKWNLHLYCNVWTDNIIYLFQLTFHTASSDCKSAWRIEVATRKWLWDYSSLIELSGQSYFASGITGTAEIIQRCSILTWKIRFGASRLLM